MPRYKKTLGGAHFSPNFARRGTARTMSVQEEQLGWRMNNQMPQGALVSPLLPTPERSGAPAGGIVAKVAPLPVFRMAL
jgi:hypothetical protein